MLRFLQGVLLFAGIAHAAHASPLVVVESQARGSVNSSSRTSFVPVTSFHVDQWNQYRNLRSEVDWNLGLQTSARGRMIWEVDAYSAYRPEQEVYDREGNLVYVRPAGFEVTTAKAQAPLVLAEPAYVRFTVLGAGLNGVRRLSLTAFDHSIVYEADAQTGGLLPFTTMSPNLATPEPLDVLGEDQWFLASGETIIDLEIVSSYRDDMTLYDGHLRFSLEFARAADWQGDYDGDRLTTGDDFLTWQRLDRTTAGLLTWSSGFGAPALWEGDFTADGRVSGDDFLWWQRGQSPNPLLASDLLDWQQTFGLTGGATADITALSVAEPVAIAQWVCCLAAIHLLRASAFHRRGGSSGARE